jgi:hypothetical protein
MITVTKRAINALLKNGHVQVKSKGNKMFNLCLRGNKHKIITRIAKLEQKLALLKEKL